MREIKFRAWDKETNSWFRNNGGFALSWDATEIIDDNDWRCETKDIVFQQFTGLKDKSGKEIYEGDILKFFDDKPIASVVFKEFGGWSFNWIDATYKRVRSMNPEPFFHNINLFEVIGNIYENPDLL